MDERRHSTRIAIAVTVHIEHPSFGAALCPTRDISEGGLFVLAAGLDPPPLGSHLRGQVRDGVAERPVFTARLMRIDEEGWGLAFVDDEDG